MIYSKNPDDRVACETTVYQTASVLVVEQISTSTYVDSQK